MFFISRQIGANRRRTQSVFSKLQNDSVGYIDCNLIHHFVTNSNKYGRNSQCDVLMKNWNMTLWGRHLKNCLRSLSANYTGNYIIYLSYICHHKLIKREKNIYISTIFLEVLLSNDMSISGALSRFSFCIS